MDNRPLQVLPPFWFFRPLLHIKQVKRVDQKSRQKNNCTVKTIYRHIREMTTRIAENRNQCRACRFQKCVKGGMNPKHVRWGSIDWISCRSIVFSSALISIFVQQLHVSDYRTQCIRELRLNWTRTVRSCTGACLSGPFSHVLQRSFQRGTYKEVSGRIAANLWWITEERFDQFLLPSDLEQTKPRQICQSIAKKCTAMNIWSVKFWLKSLRSVKDYRKMMRLANSKTITNYFSPGRGASDHGTFVRTREADR